MYLAQGKLRGGCLVQAVKKIICVFRLVRNVGSTNLAFVGGEKVKGGQSFGGVHIINFGERTCLNLYFQHSHE